MPQILSNIARLNAHQLIPMSKCLLVSFILLLMFSNARPIAAQHTVIVPVGSDPVANGQHLQLEIDNAAPGTTLVLPAGATFTGPFKLCSKNDVGKPCAAGPRTGTDADYVTIQSSNVAQLPTGRVSPSDAVNMPKLITPGGNFPVFDGFALDTSYYKFIGLEITVANDAAVSKQLVVLGSADTTVQHRTTIASAAHDFVVDRCYIHSTYANNSVCVGIALNSKTTYVTNNYISAIHCNSTDSQAIFSWNGPGVYRIINNYLEAECENLAFGNGEPSQLASDAVEAYKPDGSPKNIIAEDIQVIHNYMSKPLSQRFDSTNPWGVSKNLFEIKYAKNVTFDGNVLESCWSGGQDGNAIVLSVDNNNVTENINITNNIIRWAGSGFGITNYGRNPNFKNVTIRNNLLEYIQSLSWGPIGDGMFIKIASTPGVKVDHNTVWQDGSIIQAYDDSVTPQNPTPKPVSGFVFTNNISPHNAYGIFGGGTGVGNAAIPTYFPDGVFQKNVIPELPGYLDPSSYPTDNFVFHEARGSIKFVDYDNGDYRLKPESPYKGKGLSGADPGVDFDALYSAIAPNSTRPNNHNPIDDTKFFVWHHYEDFLSRNPIFLDRGGLQYWANQISGNATNSPAPCAQGDRICLLQRRTNVSAAFFIETEFQETGYFVYRLYKAGLNRQPVYAEFIPDRGSVVGGVQLEASKTAFVNTFMTRAGFTSEFPQSFTPAQYVDKLNANTGASLTQAERDGLVGGLNSGTETRATVLRKVADNALFKQREYNSAFVLMQYFGYLRRDPEQGGYLFWLNAINNKPPNDPSGYRQMVCSFITSAEYQRRFFNSPLTYSNNDCQLVAQAPQSEPIPPPPSGAVTFVATDATTQGSWGSKYGGDGYQIVNYASSYPAYARVNPIGQYDYTWNASVSGEPQALAKSNATNPDRIAATWYQSPSFSLDVNLTDGNTHQVALYFLDWDGYNQRSQKVEIVDAWDGSTIDTQNVSAFSQGKYLVWNIKGHVIIKLTQTGISNAVLSGLFIGGAAQGWPPAPNLKSLQLDGSSSYVDVANSSSLNITGAITVEAWIKTNSTANQSIIERYSGNDGGYILRIWQGKLSFWTVMDASNADALLSNSNITPNVWHHVAGVYDGSQMRVYIDGVLQGSKTAAFGPASGSSHLVIGANPLPAYYKFSGLLDEARVTAAALYNANFTPLTSLTATVETRGLWKFDAQTANDSSSNSNNGSLSGSVSFSTDVPVN